MKKLQLSFDFPLSIIIFIGLIIYFIILLLQQRAVAIEKLMKRRAELKALEISEILVSDVGEPENWETLALNEIKRIGLVNESVDSRNYLSMQKINRFFSICSSDFNFIKKLFNVSSRLKIVFNSTSFNNTCGEDFLPLATVSRIAYIDTLPSSDKIVRIKVMIG